MQTITARLLLAALILASACAESGTAPADDAALLAAEFTRAADSLGRAGDSSSSAGYGYAAEALRAGVTPVPVTLTENGATSKWLAVAQRYHVSAAASCTPTVANGRLTLPPPACNMVNAPVLILWPAGSLDRLLLVHAPDGTNTFPVFTAGPGQHVVVAFLIDRRARSSAAVHSGTVTIARGPTVGACASPPRMPAGATASCSITEFSASFDMQLSRTRADSTGGGPQPNTRVVLSPARTIRGMLVDITNPGAGTTMPVDSARPPGSSPPGSGNTTLLSSSLRSARSGSTVQFTFTVQNDATSPQLVRFNNSQRFDIVVRSVSGTHIWQWSADKAFAAVVGTDTIPARGSRVYRGDWPNAPRGRYAAHATLTSSTHRAVAADTVDIP